MGLAVGFTMRGSHAGVSCAVFSEDLQRDLIALKRSRRSGVRLKVNEQFDDLVLSNAVVEGDS